MQAQQDFASAMTIAQSRPNMERKQCELLISLAEASFWLMDVAGVRRFAERGTTPGGSSPR